MLTVFQAALGILGRMEPLRISACVCTYKRYESLHRTLVSLCRQTLNPRRFEVIVVDNSPLDAPAIEFRESLGRPPLDQLRAIHIAEPGTGLASARNAALAACRTELIAYIDDDAIAEPAWLEGLVDECSSRKDLPGAVGGRVLPLWESERPTWLPDKLLTYLSLVNFGDASRIVPHPWWLAGTNVAFAVEVLRRIGGFRTDLGRKGSLLISNEEIEVYNELRAMGSEVVYTPNAVVHHTVSSDRLTQSWYRRRFAAQAVSDLLMKEPGPAAQSDDAIDCYYTLLDFGQRSFENLFIDLEDPLMFYCQCKAIYAAVRFLLLDSKDRSVADTSCDFSRGEAKEMMRADGW